MEQQSRGTGFLLGHQLGAIGSGRRCRNRSGNGGSTAETETRVVGLAAGLRRRG